MGDHVVDCFSPFSRPLVAWGGPVLSGKGLMKSILVSEHPPFPIPPLTEAIGATRTAPVASSHVPPPAGARSLSSLLACCFKCHHVQEGGSCQWGGDFVCCKQEVAASCANIGVRFKKPCKVDGSCLLSTPAAGATNHLRRTMVVFDRSVYVQCGTFISSAAETSLDV